MFDIYGIGNALVDAEVEISEQGLKDLGIEKGVMALIEEPRLNELNKNFEGFQIRRACGGSAANTIISTSMLGEHNYFSSKVAKDETGCFYIKDLQDNGVVTNMSEADSKEGTTGTCFVLITPDADRSMNTFLGITSEFSEADLNEEALSASKYLYIEGYLVCTEVSLNAALKAKEIARENGVITALSLSDPGIVGFFEEGMKKLVEDCDIIFCNKDEALAFTKKETLEEAAEVLREQVPLAVITLGADGALVVNKAQEIKIDGFEVKAVDTTGAGDSFAGGFLSALSKGYSLEQAGKLGCFISSRVVSTYGPRLQTTELTEVSAYSEKMNVPFKTL
jgi:sugar/nucleoside kinase (ribokinase family)